MRALLLALLVVPALGCRGTLDGCVALCVYGPEAIKRANEPRPPPDESRTHCDELAGTSWYAENGDRMTFSATHVDWLHGGRSDRRTWSCENDRRVLLGGFREEWKGTLRFSPGEPRTIRFVNQEFRRTGMSEKFPCERVAGRTFFAENGESLHFADAGSARWSTAGGPRSVTWTCAPGEITLLDGNLVAKLAVPSHLEWLTWHERSLQLVWSADGKRPAFACDVVAGSTWRVAGSDETLAFDATTARHLLSGTTFEGAWSCRKGMIRIEGPGIRTSAELRNDALWIGSRRYDRVQP